MKMADGEDPGQEILAAIESPPSSIEPMNIDIKILETCTPSVAEVNHVLEERDKSSTPPSSLDQESTSTSHPVSSLASDMTSLQSKTSSSNLLCSAPVVMTSPVTSTPVIVPSSTAKRVILTPISAAPCVQSNSLSSPTPFSPSSNQLINRTSSPTGHPVTLIPTVVPAISLNNHVGTTIANAGSPLPSSPLLTRAVPASGYINQVSSPFVSPSVSIPSPITTGPTDPKQVGGIMSGNTVQLSKPQLPNGTIPSSLSSSSTVVITSSNAPSSSPLSTINIPVATRPNIVTATPPSSSAILGPSPTSSMSNTNGTSQPSTSVNSSPMKTTVITTATPMSKPQTVFLNTKDGTPMVLQHSTTGGPPTLVPLSSANTQPISTSSGTVITFNHQPVTSMSTSSPGPRQVLVNNPNNPMQQMILTRPGMQPTLIQAPGQLRGTPMHGQPRFVLQQNAGIRIAPQGNLRPGAPGTPVMPQVILLK